MSVRARSFCLALVVLSSTLVVVAAQEKTAASHPTPQSSAVLPVATGGQYAENDICKTCHEELWNKHFMGTPHSALSRATNTDASPAMGRRKRMSKAAATSLRSFASKL